MEQRQQEEVRTRLNEMTPSLIEGVLAIFESDPDLVARYGDNLAELVKQEVIRFRELLLGAIMIDYPPVLGKQLKWLVQVASARHYNLDTVHRHIRYYRNRLQKDLPHPYRNQVLNIFDRAVAQMELNSNKQTVS